MTSSLSLKNNSAATNNINHKNTNANKNSHTNNQNNNKNNSNMATYGKNSKKVEEVREVIQNRAESDIIKVLDVFDNDVGKTIDAFINGKV
jgi:hypothetical protein